MRQSIMTDVLRPHHGAKGPQPGVRRKLRHSPIYFLLGQFSSCSCASFLKLNFLPQKLHSNCSRRSSINHLWLYCNATYMPKNLLQSVHAPLRSLALPLVLSYITVDSLLLSHLQRIAINHVSFLNIGFHKRLHALRQTESLRYESPLLPVRRGFEAYVGFRQVSGMLKM